MTTPQLRPKRTTIALAFTALLAALWAIAGLNATDAGAVAAKTIGPTKGSKPSCPPPKEPFETFEDCNAFGHVTGFQISTATENAVFRAPEDGKIVAWSVDTGFLAEDDAYRTFFEKNLKDDTFDKYGGRPTAGISILKEKARGRFKLTKKSPIVELTNDLGTSPVFTLKKPLRIQEGLVVALTTPTWLTNFALADPSGNAGLPDTYKWRGSRKPDRCENSEAEPTNLTKLSKPHVDKGTTRKYGCTYGGSDILYRAYYLPDN